MKETTTIFPAQKLPLKKKNKEWRERCVDYIIGMSEISHSPTERTDADEMQINYNLYNGIIDKEDLLYVTNPFNQDDGFPASPQNMNIIKEKIDLLIGEETKRPFNHKVVRTSDDASSEIQEKMKLMITDYLMASAMAELDEEAAADFQAKLESGEIMEPESISKYITQDYKDMGEHVASRALAYLKEKLNLQHEFVKAWKDGLISGKEVGYVGIQNGNPIAERVNPKYFAHDQSPDLEFIEDGDWACRKMRTSYTEAYDRLYDKLDEKDLDKLLEMCTDQPNAGNYGSDRPMIDYVHLDMKTVSSIDDENINSSNSVNLWHVTWKSFKKIGFLKYVDEVGDIQETMVSEDYMMVGTEVSLEWKWIIEIWEGYRIGTDLYAGINPIEYQFVSIDNPNAQKLPYVGVIHNNSNTPSKSLVAIMKPLQYMYIIVWYRLELALSRDKGKVITMDITQIPKSMNIDAAKWMHYLSAIGVNFVNPYEEGWDIPGREGGKPAQFNQISALDLTMSDVINQYINLMSKIEEMISAISGVSKQREGAISPSELVGNTSLSVQQSAYITEPLFWMHGQFKKNMLKALLNVAKEAWRQSDKKYLHYILDDASRAFINLSDEFYNDDFDLFVSDSTRDTQLLEAIKNLYQPAMQNGATLLDVAQIMSMQNLNDITNKLSEIEQKRMEQQSKAAEEENQRQMQLIQAQQQAKAEELQMKQSELELDKYKIDSDNQTRVYVAELNAYKFQEDLDADNNGIPDVMEIADIALKNNIHQANMMDKEMQANIKQEDIRSKKNLEERKLSTQKEIEAKKMELESKKMDFQINLQKQKDKAAMEREQLKARTVIKNKTTGEK
jgi:hypothetical protein